MKWTYQLLILVFYSFQLIRALVTNNNKSQKLWVIKVSSGMIWNNALLSVLLNQFSSVIVRTKLAIKFHYWDSHYFCQNHYWKSTVLRTECLNFKLRNNVFNGIYNRIDFINNLLFWTSVSSISSSQNTRQHRITVFPHFFSLKDLSNLESRSQYWFSLQYIRVMLC